MALPIVFARAALSLGMAWSIAQLFVITPVPQASVGFCRLVGAAAIYIVWKGLRSIATPGGRAFHACFPTPPQPYYASSKRHKPTPPPPPTENTPPCVLYVHRKLTLTSPEPTT